MAEFARPTHSVSVEDSIKRAAALMRDNGDALLPILDGNRLQGVLLQTSLVSALAEGLEPTTASERLMTPAATVKGYASAAECLRRFEDSGHSTLVVVDDSNHLLGLVSPADLFPRPVPRPRPAQLGGMATPMGVYLTTGSVSGGAPKWALVLTGATMFTLLLVGKFAGDSLFPWMLRQRIPFDVVNAVTSLVTLGIFLLGLRLLPLAGTHGAEHQVVHAVERGEDLTPEVVARMPRVHPRCGTNLAAGATLFLSVMKISWIPDMELRVLLGAVVTATLWKPLGSAMQQYVTTKPPSRAQIEGAIRSAEDLLANYAASRRMVGSPWQRIWHSGVLHVITGSLIMAGIVSVIDSVFHLNLNL